MIAVLPFKIYYVLRLLKIEFLTLLILSLSPAIILSQGKDDKILASVGNYKITLSEYDERYDNYLSSTGVKDNLAVRNAILDNMINEILLFYYDDNEQVLNDAAAAGAMEGKGLLFKVFADVDVFDIEVDEKDIERFITVVKAISPTFGGINLEDIKAPECFEIEERLKQELDIPVFHDDQHGTAIISAAGLINSLEITGKKIEKIKVVINGAGASAISCARLYKKLGVRPENFIMLDSKGVLTTKRTDLNVYKREFARDLTISTLAEAMQGADMFLGLSIGKF